MTLEEYLENPSGKGNVASNNKLVKASLNERYNRLVRAKKISFEIRRIRSDIYFFGKIGSETNRGNDYDVILKFAEVGVTTTNMKKSQVTFFSNCPSFMYTYANVYLKAGLIISGTEKFLGKKILSSPKTTNPDGIIGYEKSIYYLAKFLSDNGNILKTINAQSIGVFYKKDNLFDGVRTIDEIMSEINSMNKKSNSSSKEPVAKSKSNTKNVKIKKIGTKMAKKTGKPKIGSKRKK